MGREGREGREGRKEREGEREGLRTSWSLRARILPPINHKPLF